MESRLPFGDIRIQIQIPYILSHKANSHKYSPIFKRGIRLPAQINPRPLEKLSANDWGWVPLMNHDAPGKNPEAIITRINKKKELISHADVVVWNTEVAQKILGTPIGKNRLDEFWPKKFFYSR